MNDFTPSFIFEKKHKNLTKTKKDNYNYECTFIKVKRKVNVLSLKMCTENDIKAIFS